MFSTTFPLSTLPRHPLAAALLATLLPLAADAASIVVVSPDDSDPAAAGTCTLRQAILSMNAGAPHGSCANTGAAFGTDDTITFAASTITGAATAGTIALADSADTSGAIGGTLIVSATHLTIDGSAWRGSGAGQYADGVTIARPAGASSRFGVLKDMAPAGGSLVLKGLAIRNGYAFAGGGGGIGMDAADLTMSDCRVSGNFANSGSGIWSPSGAVTLTHCTIDGNGGGEYGGGLFSGSGTVTVTASTISGNGYWNLTGGGGIHSRGTLIVVDSTISGNGGKRGAGIQTSGTLTLTRSAVVNNGAYYSGGGIHVLAGTATLTGSTISGNQARYDGAGIHSAGTLTIANSTISDNHNLRNGAGIYTTGLVHLMHATVSGNSAGGVGGGIEGDGSATIDHSIVAGNVQSFGGDIDLASPWTGSHNLTFPTDLDLGPLQDNGGTTPTMLPGPGSAAIDAIPPQDCTTAHDQRGIARPQGAGCDIGAVEVVVDVLFADGFDGS